MPVDTGFNWEAWTLPTVSAGAYTKKFDVSKAIESYNVNVRYSGLSDGTGTIDRTFPRLGDLITRDKTNPANDKGSMLRLKKGSTYIRDFVFYRLNKEWDDKKPTHDFILQGPEFLLDKARVRRYDHPRLPSTNPDWEYGATTIINELGGERVREIHTIWTNATSGTWEIVFQGQTTDPLTIPTTASDIRTAMQDLSNVEDVDVTGEGTSVTPWEITYVDPAGNVTLVTVNNSTDGVFTVNELQQGGTLDPRPWHRSYHPVTGILHGNYQQFAIDDGTSGSLFPGDSYALVVDSDSLATPTDYSGAQVIENVVPSTQYRAKVPVYCDGAPLTVRLVIRDMQENLIAASADTVIPADTWTWIEAFPITGVRIPAGVTEVIYRVGIIESTNVVPLRIAVEQAIFAPGFDEDYIGAIFNDVIQQGVAFGDLDWVTPTWTDTLDSAGVAWDMKRQWKVNHNQTFLQLLERAIKWGYEFDLYYDDGASQWKWDMFNPGGGGQTITGLSLKGKDSVKGGGGSITFPGATWFDAEGDAGQWGQYEDLVLSAAWGRIQGAIADDQGLDGTGLADLAQTRVEDASDGSESTQITLRNPEKVPFIDFQPGDSFEFDNSPIGEKRVRRCQLISIEQSPGEPGPTYQVHGDAIVFGGESALAENVRTLARKVDAIVVPRARERTWDPAMFNVGSETIGGGGIPWLVAASNSPQEWKDIAGFQCDGVDDEVEIQQAIDMAHNQGFQVSEILLAPGSFFPTIDGSKVNPDGTYYAVNTRSSSVRGAGGENFASYIYPFLTVAPPTLSSAAYSPTTIFYAEFGGGHFEHLTFEGQEDAVNISAIVGREGFGGITVRDCYFEDLRVALHLRGWNISVTDCTFTNLTGSALQLGHQGSAGVWFERNQCGGNGASQQGFITDNKSIDASITGGFPACWGVSIKDNFFDNIGKEVVRLSYADTIWFENNWIDAAGSFSGGSPAFSIWSIARNVWVRNNWFNFTSGNDVVIVCDDSNGENIFIQDNVMVETSGTSIVIDGTTFTVFGGTISGNKITTGGTANAHDCIHLVAGCDGFFITENVCAGSAPRYGINLAAASVANTKVYHNDLTDTYGTAPINLSGTGTITDSSPADATYGDNFV